MAKRYAPLVLGFFLAVLARRIKLIKQRDDNAEDNAW